MAGLHLAGLRDRPQIVEMRNRLTEEYRAMVAARAELPDGTASTGFVSMSDERAVELLEPLRAFDTRMREWIERRLKSGAGRPPSGEEN